MTDSEMDPCPEDDNHSIFLLKKAKEKFFSLPQSSETSHSEAEEEKFLESLSKSFQTSEKATVEITPHLADIANKQWGRKLAPELLRTLLRCHRKPANCTSITNMKVNPEIYPEIWGQCKKTKDLCLSHTHKPLQGVAFIILQMADCLLNWKDSEVDKISLASNAVDLVALLGHVANYMTTFKCEHIKPALREEYRQLCSADITPCKYSAFQQIFSQAPARNKRNKLPHPRGCH